MRSTKRSTASAAGFGFGVFVFKTGFPQGIHVIDFNTLDEFNAFLIDNDIDPVLLKGKIIVIRGFLEFHFIGKPRAPAGDNAETQGIALLALFEHHRLDLAAAASVKVTIGF